MSGRCIYSWCPCRGNSKSCPALARAWLADRSWSEDSSFVVIAPDPFQRRDFSPILHLFLANFISAYIFLSPRQRSAIRTNYPFPSLLFSDRRLVDRGGGKSRTAGETFRHVCCYITMDSGDCNYDRDWGVPLSRKSRCLLIEVSLGPVLINDITRVLERVARVAERDRIREAIRKISIVSGREGTEGKW